MTLPKCRGRNRTFNIGGVAITPISVRGAAAPDLNRLAEKAAFFRQHAKGDRTTQVYSGMWKAFEGWCSAAGFLASPGRPEVLSLYLSHLAESGKRPASIKVAYAAIRSHYRRHGGGEAVLESREVREILEGIVRVLPREQVQAKALTLDLLRRVVDVARVEGSLVATRDVAMLLTGFAAGLRRVELCYLGRGDVSIGRENVSFRIVKSKASQTKPVMVWVGRGSDGYCPVGALEAWLAVAPASTFLFCGTVSALVEGRVSYHTLSKVIRRRLAGAGIDPEGFSAHSLRAGLVTSLNSAGLAPMVVQHQTRHASADMLNRYHRPGDVLQVNYTRVLEEF